MALTVLSPLVGLTELDPAQLLPELPGWRREAMARAESENRLLLKQLVEAQAEEQIEQQAGELGCALRVRVTAEETEAGLFVPAEVALTGRADPGAQAELELWLERELGIGPERQRWSTE